MCYASSASINSQPRSCERVISVCYCKNAQGSIVLCVIAAAAAEPAAAARKARRRAGNRPAQPPRRSPPTSPRRPALGQERQNCQKPWYEAIPQYAQEPRVLAAELLYCSFIGGRSWLPKSKGCHVIITGGSEGLGKALAHKLVARGHFVSLVARTRSKLDAAVLEINEVSKTKNCIGVVGDVTSSSTESALQSRSGRKIARGCGGCNVGRRSPSSRNGGRYL